MAIYRSQLTVYHAFSMIRSPWKTVNGKRTVNRKQKMVKG